MKLFEQLEKIENLNLNPNPMNIKRNSSAVRDKKKYLEQKHVK